MMVQAGPGRIVESCVVRLGKWIEQEFHEGVPKDFATLTWERFAGIAA